MSEKKSDENIEDIPVLVARGKSLAQAWENSIVELYNHGTRARTQYDKQDKQGNYIDPPSIDATMLVVVEQPLSEPFIHKAFPGGPADLEEYRQEVIDGIKDHWIRNPDNPDDKRWEYTYHERLTKFSVPGLKPVNQIEKIIEQLKKAPHTRRANAITWQPWQDSDCYDPPCLQSFWFRIINNKLNMNVRFRSRDAYDAAFMNMYAFISLQEKIANHLNVQVGRYCDLSDSYHIYGSRLKHFEEMFLKQIEKRSFEERTFTRADVAEIIQEAKPVIAEKIRKKDSESR